MCLGILRVRKMTKTRKSVCAASAHTLSAATWSHGMGRGKGTHYSGRLYTTAFRNPTVLRETVASAGGRSLCERWLLLGPPSCYPKQFLDFQNVYSKFEKMGSVGDVSFWGDLWKPKDLSLGSQCPHKKPGAVEGTCNSSTGCGETKTGDPGTCKASPFCELKVSKRPCLKQ